MLRRIGGKPENADKKCGDGNTNNHIHTQEQLRLCRCRYDNEHYRVADEPHSTRVALRIREYSKREYAFVWQKRVIAKVFFAAQCCVRHSQMRIALFVVFLALLFCHCVSLLGSFSHLRSIEFLSLPHTQLYQCIRSRLYSI